MQSQRIRRTIRNRKSLPEGLTKMGNWRITKNTHKHPIDHRDVYTFIVWHYNTEMLAWTELDVDSPYGPVMKTTSTGHGSATDQQIVNAILDELGVDLYFSRKGGSHYVTRDHKDVPSYYRKVMAT